MNIQGVIELKLFIIKKDDKNGEFFNTFTEPIYRKYVLELEKQEDNESRKLFIEIIYKL